MLGWTAKLFRVLPLLVGLSFMGAICAQSSKSAPSSSDEAAPSLSSYKLGMGDVINVQVIGEDDLKREKVRLSDAGTLSFPYLGEIRVRGMTVGELEEFITKGLKGRYLLNPQVTVTISEYRNFL